MCLRLKSEMANQIAKIAKRFTAAWTKPGQIGAQRRKKPSSIRPSVLPHLYPRLASITSAGCAGSAFAFSRKSESKPRFVCPRVVRLAVVANADVEVDVEIVAQRNAELQASLAMAAEDNISALYAELVRTQVRLTKRRVPLDAATQRARAALAFGEERKMETEARVQMSAEEKQGTSVVMERAAILFREAESFARIRLGLSVSASANELQAGVAARVSATQGLEALGQLFKAMQKEAREAAVSVKVRRDLKLAAQKKRDKLEAILLAEKRRELSRCADYQAEAERAMAAVRRWRLRARGLPIPRCRRPVSPWLSGVRGTWKVRLSRKPRRCRLSWQIEQRS